MSVVEVNLLVDKGTWSKHYVIKYHWFREHNGPRQIELIEIVTDDQLGYLFTKELAQVKISKL